MADQYIQAGNAVANKAQTDFQKKNGGEAAFQFMDGSGFDSKGQVVNTEIPKVIDSSVMGGGEKINVPTVSNNPPTVVNLAEQILRNSEVEDTPTQKLGNELSTRIYDLLPKLQGETQALAEAQKTAGVDTKKQELQALNARILSLQAEINQDDIKLVANSRAEETRNTLLPFAQSAQAKLAGDAAILRALKMSEIGVINAQALAKQGEIQLALDTAKQAVDVKYAPYKEAISIYQQQLEAIKPILTRDEAKQAAAQKLKTDLYLKKLDEQRENEKQVVEMTTTASAQGAPQEVVAAASRAKTPLEAARILGKYSGDYLKYEMLKEQIKTEKEQQATQRAQRANIASNIRQNNLQNELVRANIAKIKAETGKLMAETSTGSISIPVGLPDEQRKQIINTNPKLKETQDIFNLITSLKSAPGKGGAVGIGLKIPFYGPLPGTDAYDYTVSVEQLKNALALPNLEKLKGAMSDKDIVFLKNIATKLDTGMSENAFDAELTKLEEKFGEILGIPTQNEFDKALGSTRETIPGSSIISGATPDGLNFNIPK